MLRYNALHASTINSAMNDAYASNPSPKRKAERQRYTSNPSPKKRRLQGSGISLTQYIKRRLQGDSIGLILQPKYLQSKNIMLVKQMLIKELHKCDT